MPRAPNFLLTTTMIALAYGQLGCERARPGASPLRKQPVALAAADEPTSPPAVPALPTSSAPVAEPEPEPAPPYDFAAALDSEAPPAVCETSQSAGYPPADKPSAAERARVAGTESRTHYYGIGVPVDYVKARHAAFVELEKDDGRLFGGEDILMMLYANGFGTTKNIDIAFKLACKNWHASMERDGRVSHLSSLRTRAGKKPFDVCDDITSGFMEGACAGLADEQAAVGRDAELAKLTARWPGNHVEALGRLRGVAEIFWQARSGKEVDLSGTARSAFITEEEAACRTAFLDALKRFEKGTLPSGDAEAYRAADERLNRAYKAALRADYTGTTLRPEDIRATERAWLGYRDAWVVFGAVRYPPVPAEAWKAWLSTERAKQLEQLVQQ